jgi:predicted nucleotidyltransferase
MTRDEAVKALRQIEPFARSRGVGALYLFGSTARGEAGSASDIDVFVDLSEELRPGYAFIAIKGEIERCLGVPCDLSTRRSLHPVFAAAVQAEAARVF